MENEKPVTRDSIPTFDASTRRRFLKGALGSVTSITAISALSGVAAAHFPVRLNVDVQPENATNFIDLDEHESVSVAVHPTEFLDSDGERETFDPTAEAVRYRFGSRSALDDGAGARPANDGEVVEVDQGDGTSQEVLVLNFPVDETGLDGGEETAWLFWERDESGEHGYAGVDTVSVYGTGTPERERGVETADREPGTETAEGEVSKILRLLIDALTASG